MGLLLPAVPAANAADIINQVRTEGTVHVKEQEILDVIRTKSGDDLNAQSTTLQIRDDLRAIWALGFFLNVVPITERAGSGYDLIFQVEEKPLISEFRYEGNQRYKAKKLNTEIGHTGKERLFFDESVAEKYKTKILDYYTKQSFPNTTVTWRKEPLPAANTVALVFTIKEGKRLPVKKIVFQGNTVLDGDYLRKRIQTKQSWWFIIKHHYDEVVVEHDLELVKLAYWDVGYLDVKVTKGPVEELPGGLKITFNIEEGQAYTVGDISIEDNTLFTTAELASKITLRAGDRFSLSKLSNNELEMFNLYRAQGYLPPETQIPSIQDQWIKDEKNHVVDIRIRIKEGNRKYLGKVEIQGVVALEDGTVVPTQGKEFKTKDFVILREIKLKEGEPLDWTKVIESDRRLVNLNFFKARGLPIPGQLNLEPGFERKPTSDPNVENLLLRLEETQTGMLTFGGGLSTAFGPSVFATLTERNMFGYGIRGSITGELGQYQNRLILSVFEPHLLDSDISLNWEIYYIDRKGYAGRNFAEQRIGSSVTFGKELSDELTLLFGLKGEQTDLTPRHGSIYDLDPKTLPKEFDLGTNTTTSVLFGFVHDRRNFKVDPTAGTYLRSTVELAGLTDNEFVKFQSEGNYYHPIFNHLVLALSSELDLAWAYGKPGFLPLQERFFVGGARTIRGFREGAIGNYADILYKDPTLGGFRTYLGGEAAYVGNVELRYPITEILQIVTFFDLGSVYPKIEDFDPSEFRFSTGAGLRVKIPGLNALLRLDFPVPIRKFKEDETEFFHFSFGQTF